MRRFLVLAALSLALVAAPAAPAGQNFEEKSQKLEKLREDIRQLKDQLQQDRERKDSVSAELRRLDKEVGDAAAAVQELERRIGEKRDRVAGLRAEYNARSKRMERQRDYLARQVRAAYVAGHEEYLRMLLNQEDPERLDRMLVYYDYLSRARAQHIAAALDALQKLRRLRKRLDGELDELAALKAQRSERRDRLQASRSKRSELLAKLESRIDSGDEQLQRMREDEKRLADLVQRLQQTLADIPEEKLQERPFKSVKGSLQWPLEGKLEARFGARRSGDIRWTGMLIAAPKGTPVHAVSHGRVVFADWLRGLGLLLIIDHGDGYMTLYGHNQSVYKETGDWVQAGEVVASVGESGGSTRSALYFEVRADGKPVNPQAWLRPRKHQG
jgi:septal ring factor EnvC (AmiA/AmiB activator)